MPWRNFSKRIPEGQHAFLSPSNYHWINYTKEKLVDRYLKSQYAKVKGTKLHELAKKAIEERRPLEGDDTLALYVRDAIQYEMKPEQPLWYSKFCYGTCDTISVTNEILRIHDLKTGTTPTSFYQLEIYSALFFLINPEYSLGDMTIILRIYQNNEYLEINPTSEDILPIMDKIVSFCEILEKIEEEDFNVSF